MGAATFIRPKLDDLKQVLLSKNLALLLLTVKVLLKNIFANIWMMV